MDVVARLDHLAFQMKMAQADLNEILEVLDSLRELDKNLTTLEVGFAERYSAITPVDPDILNQLDVYKKAVDGHSKAEEAKKALEALLAIHPDEKAAQRALYEAERMVIKYKKHMEAAKTIISKAAKKTMPPAFKKLVNDVQKKIADRLVRPEDLEMIPWQNQVDIYLERHRPPMKGVAYSVAFLLPNVDQHYEEWDGNAGREVRKTRKVKLRWDISESFFGSTGGVPFNVWKADYRNGTITSVDQVVDEFLKDLRGWSGLKGEGDATTRRKATAQAIASALMAIARSESRYETEGPDINATATHIHVGYRRYDKEPEDRARNQHVIDREIPAVRKRIDAALAPYQSQIAQVGFGLGDKGWVGIDVSLK
jgi:hypothetical protein